MQEGKKEDTHLYPLLRSCNKHLVMTGKKNVSSDFFPYMRKKAEACLGHTLTPANLAISTTGTVKS